MKRVAGLILLLAVLVLVVVSSFSVYIDMQKNTGAVPSALLAGFTSIQPRSIAYAGPESDEHCRQAYLFLKSHTGVRFIAEDHDSRYNPETNIVYLTDTALLENAVEAAHEFGHALDRSLQEGNEIYFSRQETFTQAYGADCRRLEQSFRIQTLFETEAYRNLAISDILFAVFAQNDGMTSVLTASYEAAGVPYWRHEKEYLLDPDHRQTEVFADIFTVFLSDDEDAKTFLKEHFPNSTEVLLCEVQNREW